MKLREFTIKGGTPAKELVNAAVAAMRGTGRRYGAPREARQQMWDIAEEAVLRVREDEYTDGQAVAMLHAYASMKVFHTGLVNSLLKHQARRVADMAAKDASTLLWVAGQFQKHKVAVPPECVAAALKTPTVKDVCRTLQCLDKLPGIDHQRYLGQVIAAVDATAPHHATDAVGIAFHLTRLRAHLKPDVAELLLHRVLPPLATTRGMATLTADKVGVLQLWNVLATLASGSGGRGAQASWRAHRGVIEPLVRVVTAVFLAEASAENTPRGADPTKKAKQPRATPTRWLNKEEIEGEHVARGWRTLDAPVGRVSMDEDGSPTTTDADNASSRPSKPSTPAPGARGADRTGIPIYRHEYRTREVLNILWGAGKLVVAGCLDRAAACGLVALHMPREDALRAQWDVQDTAALLKSATHILNFSAHEELAAAVAAAAREGGGGGTPRQAFDPSPHVFTPAPHIEGLWHRVVVCHGVLAAALARSVAPESQYDGGAGGKGKRHHSRADAFDAFNSGDVVAKACAGMCEVWRWGAALRGTLGDDHAVLCEGASVLAPWVVVRRGRHAAPATDVRANSADTDTLQVLLETIARVAGRLSSAGDVNTICRSLLRIHCTDPARTGPAVAALAAAAVKTAGKTTPGYAATTLLFFAKARTAALRARTDVPHIAKQAIVALLDAALHDRARLHGNGLMEVVRALSLLRCDSVPTLKQLAGEIEQRLRRHQPPADDEGYPYQAYEGGGEESAATNASVAVVTGAGSTGAPLSFKAQVVALNSFVRLKAKSTVLLEAVSHALTAGRPQPFQQLNARGTARLLDTYAAVARESTATAVVPPMELLAASFALQLRERRAGALGSATVRLVLTSLEAVSLSNTVVHQRVLRALSATGDAAALVRSVDALVDDNAPRGRDDDDDDDVDDEVL